MLVRVPDYFDDFSCLAGACPHSCCIGWEGVIDEDTVRRYQAEPGPLGDRLRAAMRFDGEDLCFPLNGGRCPFLNQENLCDIHCALGPEATSLTCREHPRFIEDYGPFQEINLSAACCSLAVSRFLFIHAFIFSNTYFTLSSSIPHNNTDSSFMMPVTQRLGVFFPVSSSSAISA